MVLEKPFSGKIALITGGNRGIGLAIARTLGKLGARLAISGRNRDALKTAIGELKGAGYEATPFVADMMRPEEILRLVEEVHGAMGEIEVLVNNAGLGWFKPVHEFSESDWDTMLDTNLKAVFLLSKAVVPEMIARGSGSIINISSLAGKNTFPNGSVYCASKWGLMGLTGCMAEDLRGHGIRVAAVCPGSVGTEFSNHSGRDPSKLLQAEDVAHAVEMILTQGEQSFISEIQMRPRAKP
jgi:3-oxoacyl-[acyl-carrier protein] reductase